jgi:hypothetical protein
VRNLKKEVGGGGGDKGKNVYSFFYSLFKPKEIEINLNFKK